MFDWIASSLKAAFTPPGTNAKNAQNNRNAAVARMGLEQLQGLNPAIKRLIELLAAYIETMRPDFDALAGSYTGSASNLIRQAELLAGSDYGRAMADMVGNQALSSGLQSARNIAASMPLDPAGKRALQLGAMNNANLARNAALLQYNDPSQRAQRLAGANQLMQAGMQGLGNNPYVQQLLPMMNLFAQSSGSVYGQPQVQVGQGLGDLFGTVLGSWAGSGFKIAGKGGTQA